MEQETLDNTPLGLRAEKAQDLAKQKIIRLIQESDGRVAMAIITSLDTNIQIPMVLQLTRMQVACIDSKTSDTYKGNQALKLATAFGEARQEYNYLSDEYKEQIAQAEEVLKKMGIRVIKYGICLNCHKPRKP